jgi:hypothetical protein
MEFVIAQARTKKSPIVLSEFMGISKNMVEALQVNPWNLGVSQVFLEDFNFIRLLNMGSGCCIRYSSRFDDVRKGKSQQT